MTLGRLRLGLLLFAPLAAVATLLLILFPARLNSAAMTGARQRAQAVSAVLARSAAAAVDFDDAEHAREVVDTVADDSEVVRVALRGSDGALLAYLPAGEREAAAMLPSGGGERTIQTTDALIVVTPVFGRSGNKGSLAIMSSLDGVAAQRRQNIGLAAAAAGVTLAVGVTFSVLATFMLMRRRRAEAELARSKRNLTAVIEASPDAMVVHRGHVIAYVNPATRRLLPPGAGGDLTGRDITEIFPDVPAPDAPQSETTLGPQGASLTVEIRSLSIAFDGAPAILTIARDVTAVRRMQAQLLIADRMASVGTLAAGVAHEINNPLSFVAANLSYATDALRQPSGAVPVDEVLGALDDAQQGSERVSRIVRDLKTFSRADDEKRSSVDLHAALDLSLQMTSSALRHRATVVKSYGAVPRVDGSESRLGQVFVNLLVNAAQALPDDGHQHLVEISTFTDGAGRAVVKVRDTGKGMPPEVQARIFDPFFTTKPLGVGTGLGLSICHNIVTGLGGQIAVESRIGEGTTFTITLPAAVGAPISVEAHAVSLPATRRGRVLVIDDEPLVAKAMRRTLERDTVVESSISAMDALARFRAGERFDAVLCDLMMPEMTGMDLYDQLAQVAPEQLARVIFVTGAVFPGRARDFLEHVDRPHLEKPFDPRVLRELVKSVVEQGKAA